MSAMFCYCSGLESLDVSSFDTRNVRNMGSMFYCCTKLKSLDLSSFSTEKISLWHGSYLEYQDMLWRCNSLETIKFGTKFQFKSFNIG